MAPLSSRHHAVIQALLSRGPLSEPEFRDLFAAVTGKNPVSNRQAFNDFLLLINKELAYVQLELRGCVNQYDGEIYYGVVNNVGDEAAKLGTRFSVPQIAFYKALVEAIVQDSTIQGFVTNIDALNIRLENQVQTGQSSQDNESRIPPAFKNFSISQKERTLSDLIEDRWLCRISNGKIGLGVRSFLDLRSWFRNNDVPPCDVCNEAGVKASTCQNEGCNIRMHDYCSKKKFSRQKAGRVCPSCNTAWPEEENDYEEEDEEDVNASHQLPRRTRKRTAEVEAEDVNESGRRTRRHTAEVEVEVEEDEDLNGSHQARSNDGPGRRTRKRTAEVEVETEAEEVEVRAESSSAKKKKKRRVKAENIGDTDAGPSQSNQTSPDQQRNRRSQRVRVNASLS